MSMHRLHAIQKTVAVGTTAADSTAIPFQGWSGGLVVLPASSSITTITWYVAITPDDTFVPAKDGIGGAVTTTIAQGQGCLIPAALFAAGAIKAVGNAAGVIDVSLKS